MSSSAKTAAGLASSQQARLFARCIHLICDIELPVFLVALQMHRPLRCVLSQNACHSRFLSKPRKPDQTKTKTKKYFYTENGITGSIRKGRPEKQRFSVVAE
jgi:hypothetical protein